MAKKHLYQVLFLIFLWLLEIALSRVFAEEKFIIPQLVLLYVIVLALTRSQVESIWYAFAAGFLQEVFSGLFFGAHVFSLIIIAVLVYFVTRHWTVQDISFVASVLTVFTSTILLIILTFFYHQFFVFLNFAEKAALGSFFGLGIVLTIFLNLIFFYLFRALFTFFIKRNERPL